jgi:glyoxylase-like metal-dependent hydrolase (beta-lactamase superfamily II)
MRVGDVEITALHDGQWRLPATVMYSNTEEDWLPHRQFLGDDGMLPCELGGFLVRSGERLVLVDTGAGPNPDPAFGRLLASLAAVGLSPDDITDVVLTHLHFDHVGWASDGERAVFANATYRCDERDWDFFVGPEAYDEGPHLALLGGLSATDRLSPVAARLETWSSDVAIAPGVDLRAAPGHTPGSTVVVVSSGEERAILLGDAVHCPVELLEDEWEFIADVDPALARRTRAALVREIEGAGIPVAAAHFPEMRFGRLLPAAGGRNWVFD